MDESPAVASDKRQARRPVAIVAVVIALFGAAWWVTHPTRLSSVGSEVGLQGEVGEPVIVGLFAYPGGGSVVLRDASPRVLPGSAAADVRVLWCASPTGDTPIGALRATAVASCRETPKLDGQPLAIPSAKTRFGHLVLEIVPREPGEVTVEGADVAYSAGLQRGRQASGVVVRVVVPRDK